MTSVRNAGLLLVLLASLSTAAAFQDTKDDKQPALKAGVFITKEAAGPDYLIQGEYEGTDANKQKLGAQVVALDGGKFEVYVLGGGLPGAGWNTKDRVKVEGKTQGGNVVVTGADCTGTIASGKFTGKGPGGDFTLVRVERTSPTLGMQPPAGAIVLFDGNATDKWTGGKAGEPKIVEGNLLLCGVKSKDGIGAGKFHLEFRTPYVPKGKGQGRGNSGVSVLGSEIQVLDSFGLSGEKNECGALYGKAKPAVNMCLPPLTWQTYDVEIANDGKSASMTVYHNGVKIHDKVASKSGAASVSLQDHGNHVVYRNIWYVPAK